MKRLNATVVSAAVTGILLGSGTMSSCGSSPEKSANATVAEKHACKGLNSCANKGGCKSGDKNCAGKNSCAGKGGCHTVEHACKAMNGCKAQGGCKTDKNACAGKNECGGKGGCKVPKQ